MERVTVLVKHLESKKEIPEILYRNPTFSMENDDIVIVAPFRTAVGKSGKGVFAKTPSDKLLEPVLKHILSVTKIDPSLVGDIVIGKVMEDSSMGATQVRIASLLAGFPETVPCQVLNRQCSSGLQSIASVVSAIRGGMYDIGVAGGVESMSHGSFAAVQKAFQTQINMDAMKHSKAKGCYLPMGLTSENVATKFGVSREKQDFYSAQSHKRAFDAQKSGKFKDEIVPVPVVTVDDKTDEEKTVWITEDEGIRGNTTVESLSKLKPAFKKDGSTTAGNSSQTSDGAAAMLVMRRSTAKKLGLKPALVFREFSVVGVDPSIMGIGPYPAIQAVLKKSGLKVSDIDLFEINEAFASQFAYTVEGLGLDMNKVNVNGGAIALGHALGSTGSRQVATLYQEMKRRGSKYGITSMCIGSGMGAAAIFEYEK
jgi:acetyl-CoA acyltransferase 1